MDVYLMHRTRTPRNVRWRWEHAAGVPRVGDIIDMPDHIDGKRCNVRLVVDEVVWLGGADGRSATVYVRDADPAPAPWPVQIAVHHRRPDRPGDQVFVIDQPGRDPLLVHTYNPPGDPDPDTGESDPDTPIVVPVRSTDDRPALDIARARAGAAERQWRDHAGPPEPPADVADLLAEVAKLVPGAWKATISGNGVLVTVPPDAAGHSGPHWFMGETWAAAADHLRALLYGVRLGQATCRESHR